MNNGYNIDHPYNDRDRLDKLISLPNGNAGSLNERFVWGKMVLAQENGRRRTCAK